MSSTNELNESTNVVLKLSLGEGDEAQVRRITLPRLWENGRASYSRLVDISLEYDKKADRKLADDEMLDVIITYTDEDGDTITISSDEELADAFGQFVETKPPVLRVKGQVVTKKATTTAKPAVDTSPPPPPPPPMYSARNANVTPPQSPRQPNSPPPTTGPNMNASSMPSQARAAPQIHALLESFVSILASAILALQEKVSQDDTNKSANSAPSASPRPAAAAATATGPTTAETELAKETAERLMRDVVTKIALERKDDTSTTTSSSSSSTPTKPKAVKKVATTKPSPAASSASSSDKKPSPTTTSSFASKPPAKAPFSSFATKPSAPPPPPLETPFVHGRHTCDGCLATPIIGTRYHATNLPDYDLCAKCFDNYQGKDIHFKPEVLDRDKPLQHRWARRQARKIRQARFGGEFPGQCRMANNRNRRMMREKQDADFETSLKEAIRRSLKEVKVTTASVEPTEKKEVKEEVEKEEVQEERKEEEKKEEKEVQEQQKEVIKGDILIPPPATEEKETVEEIVEMMVEDVAEKIEDAAKKIEEVAKEVEEEAQKVAHKTEEVEKVAPEVEEEVEKQIEEKEDPKLTTDEDAAPTETPEEPEQTTTTPPRAVTSSPDRSTYSSEAEECGSIAKDIGATLDRVAGGIDDIVDEINGSMIQETSNGDDDASDVSDDDVASVEADDNETKLVTSTDSISVLTPSSFERTVSDQEKQEMEKVKEEETASETSEPEIVSSSMAEEPEVATEAPQEELRGSAEHEGGATILNSVGTSTAANEIHEVEQHLLSGNAFNDQDASSSESQQGNDSDADDWDVVDEKTAVEHQIANDEALARAASLIGSALFQSDLSNSLMGQQTAGTTTQSEQTEESAGVATQSTSSSSSSSSSNSSSASFVSDAPSVDSVPSSVASSVPTISSAEIVPPIAAPSTTNLSSAVLSRWENELNQLRELGFMDDAVSVDALESLQAANIGAGSDDVVTVNDAVNRILANHYGA